MVKHKINIMEKFTELKELIATAEKDVASFFEKGNKAAGTRLRTQCFAKKQITGTGHPE